LDAVSADLLEAPDRIHEEAERKCRGAMDLIDRMTDAGADFIYLPHDVAFNAGPFISPVQFGEFVAPYWARLVSRVKERGALAIIHTDGQIMADSGPSAFSGGACAAILDPMAGVDIAEVKRLTYGRFALMGNVQCNLLQDGPREAIRASALYCLEHASPGGGYIFSTSNTIFPGMPWRTMSTCSKCFGIQRALTRGPSNTGPLEADDIDDHATIPKTFHDAGYACPVGLHRYQVQGDPRVLLTDSMDARRIESRRTMGRMFGGR